MRVLGLDPASKCGWALVELTESGDVRRLGSGRWTLHRTGDPRSLRFLRLWRELTSIQTVCRIDVVAYEKPGHYKSWDATAACFGIAMHVESWAKRHGVRCEAIAITDVKKLASGKGKCAKSHCEQAARRLFGHTVSDDDEADALLVAWLAATGKSI